jgi:hypothetical protein
MTTPPPACTAFLRQLSCQARDTGSRPRPDRVRVGKITAVRRGSPLDYDHHAGHPDVGILRAASQGVSEEGSLIHFFDPAAVGGQQRGEVVHHVARDAGHASMGDQRLGQLMLRPFSRRGR